MVTHTFIFRPWDFIEDFPRHPYYMGMFITLEGLTIFMIYDIEVLGLNACFRAQALLVISRVLMDSQPTPPDIYVVVCRKFLDLLEPIILILLLGFGPGHAVLALHLSNASSALHILSVSIGYSLNHFSEKLCLRSVLEYYTNLLLRKCCCLVLELS